MIAEGFTIQTYAGTSREKQALARLTESWDFWSYEDIMEILSSVYSRLFYLADAESWQALLLYQAIPPVCDVIYIYVAPLLREKGVGLLLLDELKRRAEQAGDIESLFLEVRPTNKAAIGLYKKFGMSEVSRRRMYYNDGEDALVFVRKIKPC